MRRHNSVVVENVKLYLRNNVPKQFFEVSLITDGAWTKNHAVLEEIHQVSEVKQSI